MVSETREELAPVTLFKGTPNQVTFHVGGEWVLRAVATGKPGGAAIEYNPPTGNTDLVSVEQIGKPIQTILKTQDIFGPGMLPTQISIPPSPSPQYLAQINVGEKPRAKGSENNPTAPLTSADGTKAEAAVDVVRLDVVVPGVNQDVIELRIGHMEANATAPSGGIDCPIPVSKTATPDPVTAGNPFTWTITIPSNSSSLAGTDCDLLNISATDVATVLSGSPVANITGVSNGGTPSTGTVSTGHNFSTAWANLGNYHPGDPPLVVTISGSIPASSGAGVIQNTVNVTASLGNCKGGAAGTDLIGTAAVKGTALLVGAAVKGTATVQGPKVLAAQVQPARLAETGQKQPWLPVAGGGLLLGALALLRSRRRLQEVRHEA